MHEPSIGRTMTASSTPLWRDGERRRLKPPWQRPRSRAMQAGAVSFSSARVPNELVQTPPQRSASRGISSTKLQGLCRLSSCARRIPSHASRQAPREPGSTNTNVVPISPPVARDCSELGAHRRRRILVEQHREPVHPLLEQRLQRLRRHVAAGEAGAAGGDDRIDRRDRSPSPSPDRGSRGCRRAPPRARRSGARRPPSAI